MGKSSGGVRDMGINENVARISSGRNNEFVREVRGIFNEVENVQPKLQTQQTSTLRRWLKDAKSYNPNMKSQIINKALKNAKIVDGKVLGIDHPYNEGVRSEVIRIAHLANSYKNREAIKNELKKRKK